MKYDGKLFIDEADAYTEYGVFVEQYGYKELIQMPSFKKLDTTDWPEYDGQEVDLISPVLDSRELQIQFDIVNVRYAEDLFLTLSNGAYHDFRFVELEKTYRLRMVSNGSFTQNIRLGKLTITFADDFPVVPVADYYKTGVSDVNQSGYAIDDVDMAQFGTYVLEDTDASFRKAASVRKALSIDISSLAGIDYDQKEVHFQTKDVTVKLLINAKGIDEFWKRWNSLFAVLLQPEVRKFYLSALEAEYECYYKSNSVSKFDILRNGHVWCEFSVVLVFTAYRPESSWMLLATEDFDWVITEDGLARIKVRPKYGISLLVTEDGKYIITESDSDKIYINNQK
jgi:hypothetical protein|nr:MAG TPA: hypothetical protein [Caudoviricetes sp.]